jgi:hypothetical protein
MRPGLIALVFQHLVRQCNGSVNASSWNVTPKPGPDVRGSPSFWYFADPIAVNRLARVSAEQLSHPREIRSHPVVGFQVVSIHSIWEAVLMPPPPGRP